MNGRYECLLKINNNVNQMMNNQLALSKKIHAEPIQTVHITYG